MLPASSRQGKTVTEQAQEKDKRAASYKELREWAQAILTAVIIALIIRTFFLEIIQVDGASMLPTLNHGDRVAANKLSYRIKKPSFGDIIIFRNPENPKINYVKRVIGLPGDTIEILDGRVIRNGLSLKEDYLNQPPRAGYPKTRIPEGHLFVLGDNRNFSKDSRDPGVSFIPKENVLGKVKMRLWPLWDIRFFR